MSADGEVEVQVKAEGVDEASQELAGEGGVGDGGDGAGAGAGGDQQSGLRGSLRAGLFAGLVTSLAGPLLDVLSPILDVLNAFLAPIAALILRLLSPFLRFMLTKILPPWMNFLDMGAKRLEQIRTGIENMILGLLAWPLMLARVIADFFGIDLVELSNDILSLPQMIWDFLVDGFKRVRTAVTTLASGIWNFMKTGFNNVVSFLSSLPGDIWDFFVSSFNSLVKGVRSLASEIWQRVQQLAGMIGREIAERLPNVDTDSVTDPTGEDGILRNNPVFDAGQRAGTQVNISGGLGEFVESVDTNNSIDFPS